MAVVVQCYHCSNILELDEGFRGGVCRCSQCGSLLQVPKSTGNETRKARPAAPGARVTPVQRPASPAGGDGGGGSGGVRTGDGGGSSGAFARSPMRPAAPGGAPAVARSKATQGSVDIHAQADRIKKSTPKLWVGIGLAVLIGAVLLIVVGTWIASSMREDRRPAVVGGGGHSTAGQAVPNGAHFLTIKLTGKKIVFGLDAGSGNTECYSYFTEAVAKAVGTLGDEQEYCVVLWKDGGPERFPSSGWANKSGLTGVQKGMDIGPNGVAEPLSSMKYCVSVGGDQTILVTAKTDLTADMAGAVVAARKEGQQIDTVGVVGNIDSVAPDSALKAIADKAGGTYLPVDVNRLRELLHPVN